MPQLAPRLLLAAALCGSVAVATTSQAAPSTNRPAYTSYVSPTSLADRSGEPSIGVNWRTGSVLLQSSLDTARITFDASGKAVWKDVTDLQEGIVSLDAIAASDNTTGRFFVSQLTGFGSLMAFTDDDGATWTPSQGAGIPAGADHQTVASGPYPEGASGPLTSYPNAVYYCSQEIGTALCARSDDGGLTFGAGIPTYTLADCHGLHGHVRVGPDGTIYLPNKNCGGHQSVVVSTDAGLTWTLRALPGSTSGSSDPSVSAGRDGTVYASWVNGDGTVHASESTDRGRTWKPAYDLGRQVGVVNAAIPSTIAGDGDRAAVAFIGTTTVGKQQDQFFGQDTAHKEYVGASQHLYIASTTDRGKSWTTVDATGKDPVQRGRVCLAGTTCAGGDRNLLDFLDIQVDREGRVLVGWADGCTGTCVGSNLVAANTHTSKGMLTRQSGGPRLFAVPRKVSS